MITKARIDTYCDYCQDIWGGKRVNNVWVWHSNAKTQAIITIQSTRKSNIVRSYCSANLEEIQNWPTVAKYYDINKQVKGEDIRL